MAYCLPTLLLNSISGNAASVSYASLFGDMGPGGIICLLIIIGAGYFLYKSGRRNPKNYIVPANTRQLLAEHVDFYKKLGDPDKKLFEARVTNFLNEVAIKGVDVAVEDLDRVLVAAGGIIPIFAFKDWKYNNLAEVLLYKGEFDEDFNTDSKERNVLGMVGGGPLQKEMLLSQPSLRASFYNAKDGNNTTIHEFAHLIDKADGATDGIPEYLLARPYIMPWVQRMHETIKTMKVDGKSDIDIYGARSDAEFFAVVTEYFFERPERLREKHPELYTMVESMFIPK
jgi:Mlc titration factor MtfA (ptsG expression regulator)